jgi:Phage integrase, N-terminal SAM-like domain
MEAMGGPRVVAYYLFASTKQATYEGALPRHLMPAFGDKPLRDISTLTLQRYVSEMGTSYLSGDRVLKIKEVLSSALYYRGRATLRPTHQKPMLRGPDTTHENGQ